MQIQELTPENWEDFTKNLVAVMILGKTDCQACQDWSAELTDAMDAGDVPDNVAYGKLMINQKGLLGFKKANAWLAEVDTLPFNVIYQNGEVVKKYAGGGLARLTNRLDNLS